MQRNSWYYLASPLKATEGGPSRDWIRHLCKEVGVRVRFDTSSYVGLVDVEIGSSNKRIHKKLTKKISCQLVSWRSL